MITAEQLEEWLGSPTTQAMIKAFKHEALAAKRRICENYWRTGEDLREERARVEARIYLAEFFGAANDPENLGEINELLKSGSSDD